MSALFSSLYARVMRWVQHRHAPWYLGALSFAESSLFPVPPPDIMLAPMSLAQPQHAWRFALLTTITSVVGGLFGYMIGLLLFDLIEPLLHRAGYWDSYLKVHDWFETWGFWAIFLAAFSPLPYKLFNITAGVIAMALLPFVLASLIGRGARYFLVAALMRWGGPRMEAVLRTNIEWMGWSLVIAAVLLYLLMER